MTSQISKNTMTVALSIRKRAAGWGTCWEEDSWLADQVAKVTIYLADQEVHFCLAYHRW